MMSYTDLININCAPATATQIGVYDKDNNKVGKIELASLSPNVGEKQYTFAALSDVHVNYQGERPGVTDWQYALNYLFPADSEAKVDFVCICGDMTGEGSEAELTTFKNVINECSTAPAEKIYFSLGNHEGYHVNKETNIIKVLGESSNYADISDASMYPLCYTITKGDDLFIMFGVSPANGWNISSWSAGNLFAEGELQWLYETLEANRDKKRIFLFEHVLSADTSGDILNKYDSDLKLGTDDESIAFKSLLKHYKNIIWFHGHTHTTFTYQIYGDTANYETSLGCHSIHIPSLAATRIDSEEGFNLNHGKSEGYIVEVYDNGILLRGRDFITEKFLPLTTYWIPTEWVEVAAGTYVDSTGLIVSKSEDGSENVAVVFHDGYQVQTTHAHSNSGGLTSQSYYSASDIIYMDEGYEYSVYGSDVSGLSCYFRWYTKNGGFIGGSGTSAGWSTDATGDQCRIIAPPVGAQAFRLQCYTNGVSGLAQSKVTVRRVADATKVYNTYDIKWNLGHQISSSAPYELVATDSDIYAASEGIPLAGANYTVCIPEPAANETSVGLKVSLIYYDAADEVVFYDKDVLVYGTYSTSINSDSLPVGAENATYVKLRLNCGVGHKNQYNKVYMICN